MSLELLSIQLGTASIILTSALWIIGKMFAGKNNVKFSDSLWIGIIGVIISTIISLWLSGWVATIGTMIMILVLLKLIKHFFECSWREGFMISVSSWIIYWVMTLILLPPILM